MSIYDNFSDSPNQIKVEGQEITIKFQRTSPTTARITWNIPPPAHGCTAENRAYDGIVVTISNVPANYLTTSPKNGTYYDADPTADPDLHAGSVLDGARVVGAFYHDTTTTVLDISDIKERTPYYVSGYAVDSVARYHREGVHAYSLPTGTEIAGGDDFPAKHEILLYSTNPLTANSPTGLNPTMDYVLPVKIECMVENFTLHGSDIPTYGKLVAALNKAFALYYAKYAAPLPPHSGDYLRENGLYYQWNGTRLFDVSVVESAVSPSIATLGTYWINTTTNVLHVYTSLGWVVVAQIITSTSAPTELAAYTIWFDGTTVRVWENGHWCDYTTIISARNPQLPPDFSAGDFWFDSLTNAMFKWNDILQKWDDALVIYYDRDPNTLNTGDFWYDEKISKIKRFVGSNWNTVTGVIYEDAAADGDLPADSIAIVIAGTYWYDTKNDIFYQRDLMNIAWDVISFVSFPVNPRNRKSCDLWWNSSPSVNDLFVWEAVTSTWVPVNNFYVSVSDPNVPPMLDENTAWVKPDGSVYLITPTDCSEANVITSPVNPRDIQDGMIWLDDSGAYFMYVSGEWVRLTDIIRYPSDPYVVVAGMLWFDTVNDKLFKYDGTTWVAQCIFFNRAFLPTVGQQWFNTLDEVLMEWTGTAWNPTSPFIKAEFAKRSCLDAHDKLIFSTRKVGCHEFFQILSVGNTMFDNLINSVIYTDPLDGYDGVDGGSMYMQLGVGDDGSPDERRRMHEQVRMAFGSPSVRVELTKQQIDNCIDNALLLLRKYSSYSYKKGMFFLDLTRNQQVYVMSNRCVGYNKIVDILALHRPKAGAFKLAFNQNDNFAFAALQQMYSMGTFDILTYHLTMSYIEELDTLFASRIMYQWHERKRELKLYQIPHSKERILVEALLERTEQDLLTDRETAYWLRRWIIVEAKAMLAQTRGKFASLPGPNGTTVLNASDLQTQLEQERTELMEELQGHGMQDLIGIGLKRHFILG